MSHERAAAAQKEGRSSTTKLDAAGRSPSERVIRSPFEVDEGVRPGTTAETLGNLRPAFEKSGNITAGNASQISDGASAVVMMSKAKVDELGVSIRSGEVVAYGQVAGPDASLLTQPSRAIFDALDRVDGLSLGDIDLFELNEAFAAVALASYERSWSR